MRKPTYYTLLTLFFLGILYYLIFPIVSNAINIVKKFPTMGIVNEVDTIRKLPTKILQVTNMKTNAKDTVTLDGLHLVNSWATWCAPCKDELPELDSLELIYPTLKVWLVSHDSPENLKNFNYSTVPRLESYALSDTLFFKKEDAIPVTYLVKDGFIIETFYGRKQWLSEGMKHFVDSLMLN